jgi:hypothetical protein
MRRESKCLTTKSQLDTKEDSNVENERQKARGHIENKW